LELECEIKRRRFPASGLNLSAFVSFGIFCYCENCSGFRAVSRSAEPQVIGASRNRNGWVQSRSVPSAYRFGYTTVSSWSWSRIALTSFNRPRWRHHDCAYAAYRCLFVK